MAADGKRRGGRSKSSERWLQRQRKDRYTRQAQAGGLPSRAYYKLAELDERCGLLRPGLRILELGAAPGGWTRYLENSRPALLIACDPSPITCSAATLVVEGRFGEDEAVAVAIADLLRDGPLDLVLSDMAPTMSGVRAADQARAVALAELTLEAAERFLKPGGDLLVKIFQGEGFEELVSEIRSMFDKVRILKPKASRSESREVYLVGRQFLARR